MLSLEDNETVWHKRVWWRKFVWWNSKTFTDFLAFCTANMKLLKCLLPRNSALFIYFFTCSVMKWTCVVICFLHGKGGMSTHQLSLCPVSDILCVRRIYWSHPIMLLLMLHIALSLIWICPQVKTCLSHSNFATCSITMRVSRFSVNFMFQI